MKKVRLIHWHQGEAQGRRNVLEAAGYEVHFEALRDQTATRGIGDGKPDAIVVDLSRLPAQGRDLAIWLRQQKRTRHVPLVFLGGDPAKIEKIKTVLPDAVYSDWSKARSALRKSLANPPKNPVVPESAFAGYSETPLPKKLGIKPGSVVALLGAPADLDRTLGPLPEGAVLRPSGRGQRDLTVCFVRSRTELKRRLASLVRVSEQGNVWIAWPKKASSMKTDLTQNHVRRVGLDAGLVDFKICAIDETWSGLCFALRRR